MSICPATPADIPAILALERACSTAAHWNELEYSLIFDPGATPRMLLVAGESKLAGFIVAHTIGPEWEIENVAVVREQRGHGIGKALVSAVIDEAKRRAAAAIFLEVRASNAAARALYSHAGFAETGRRRAYYSHPEEDAVLYRLHLGDSSQTAP